MNQTGFPNFKDHIRDLGLHEWGVILLYEDIIKPGILRLPSTDIQKLNKQYNSSGIFFHKGQKNDYSGHYDPINDEIHIYFDSISIDELSAILSHELVHKEQHRRSGGKWLEQIEKRSIK